MKPEIMMRIIFLHRLKRLVYSPWSRFAILTALMVAGFSLVSVTNVFANWWHSGAHSEYLLTALLHAGLTVQLIIVGLTLSGLSFFRGGLKYLRFGQLAAF